MDDLEHLNAALLVLFKLHVTIGNVALGDVDEGLRRPSCEPINRAAIDERRELSQSRSENLTKGRHSEDHVDVLLDAAQVALEHVHLGDGELLASALGLTNGIDGL